MITIPDPVEDQILVDLKMDSFVLAFDNATYKFYVGMTRVSPCRANRFHA